eukprot:c24339_g9_i1 orf=1-1578(-)
MPLSPPSPSHHLSNQIKTALRTLSSAIRSGHLSKAIAVAEAMQAQGICLTRNQAYHWLQECGKQHNIDLAYAKRLQYLIVFSRLDSVQVLADHLIRQFTSCGSLVDADLAFNKVANPSAYTWSAIISAHAKLGKAEAAHHLYCRMIVSGSKIDKYVFLAVLKACTTLASVRLIHDHIIQSGLQSVVMMGNAMIDLYAKLGSLEEAHAVFDRLLHRDAVSCNSMITACTQYGKLFQALDCFKKMQGQGIDPDDVTFSSILITCSSVGAIKMGRLIHHHIIETDLQSFVTVGTALADMYGKCGSIVDLLDAFRNLPYRDIVSWGALISGCVQCGKNDLAMAYFHEMQAEGFKPNEVTFTSIFAACSNAGLIDEGCTYLRLMTSDFGLKPNSYHCLCVIDLLARAGKLADAESMVQNLDSGAIVAWRSLLSACKTYGNVELGRRCFDHVSRLDPNNASGYTLMSRIYSDAGMLEEAYKIDKMRGKCKPRVNEVEVILKRLRKEMSKDVHTSHVEILPGGCRDGFWTCSE